MKLRLHHYRNRKCARLDTSLLEQFEATETAQEIGKYLNNMVGTRRLIRKWIGVSAIDHDGQPRLHSYRPIFVPSSIQIPGPFRFTLQSLSLRFGQVLRPAE